MTPRLPWSDPPRAIVLGSGHPRAYGTVRLLARRGIAVDVVHERRSADVVLSRYVRRRVRLAAVPSSLPVLEAIGRGAVLLPTTDDWVEMLGRHHRSLSQSCRLACSPWELVEPLLERRSLYAAGERLGIAVPEAHQPADGAHLDALVARLDFEATSYVLKTDVHAEGEADPVHGRNVAVGAATPSALATQCREIHRRTGAWPLIESVVPGDATCCLAACLVLDAAGGEVSAFVLRRLALERFGYGGGADHPYDLGANAYAESAHDDEVLETGRRLARAAQLTGPVVVEFRRDPRDGRLVLIKVDPRVTRAVTLSAAIGQDVPWAAYTAALGCAAARAAAYPAGRRWIWLSKYWRGARHGAPLLGALRGAARLVREAADLAATAMFDPADPMPALAQLVPARVRRRAARRLEGGPRRAA